MASAFAQILYSKTFTFLIGDDMIPIVVHSGAIAALSPPLSILLNGPMKEARQNMAEFADLEPEDFERVCEFAYTGGSFTQPKADVFHEGEVNIHEDFFVLHCRLAWITAAALEPRKARLLSHFLCNTFGRVRRSAKDVFTPADYQQVGMVSKESDVDEHRDRHWKEDVATVLLAYARMYVFAEQYLIEDLKKSVMKRLRKYLVELDIFPLTRSGIIDLVRFVYDSDHTFASVEGDALDPLRKTVVEFIVLHLDAFTNFAEHRQLLREGGDYVVDFHDTIRQWLL
ncbi:hypothetical protein BDW02DRAFT_626889 [Decorospora gaudefroyi]|uniref:BTB domain-containing protein n=1 Tax=Decorospora gaudefroyi TaxID=184978 RepID=A0A6A5KYI1_9PLEO|nr:hypothetical protein BDW02DRAFT_626889 [Decorospora gaudefroyi]